MPAREPDIAEAAEALRRGQLVAFPTETVYGLGADAASDRAVAALFAVKGRPEFNPLIVHVTDLAAAERLGRFGADARRLAAAFWPGPLTLVVRRVRDCPVSLLASAGLDTLGLRVPAHPLAQALLRTAALPVAAPSANKSGRLSPTSARDVRADFAPGEVAVVLDGGPSPIGIESTVVACLDERPMLLRPGATPRAAIERALGKRLAAPAADAARLSSPGRLRSHYAPRARLRLEVREVMPGEALLAFGPAVPHDAAMRNLSPSGDLAEAAANLFRCLRDLDQGGAETIAVMPIPNQGLGEAINDRLARAAAPRVTAAAGARDGS